MLRQQGDKSPSTRHLWLMHAIRFSKSTLRQANASQQIRRPKDASIKDSLQRFPCQVQHSHRPRGIFIGSQWELSGTIRTQRIQYTCPGSRSQVQRRPQAVPHFSWERMRFDAQGLKPRATRSPCSVPSSRGKSSISRYILRNTGRTLGDGQTLRQLARTRNFPYL